MQGKYTNNELCTYKVSHTLTITIKAHSQTTKIKNGWSEIQ